MVNVNKFSMGATAAITTSMGLIAGLTHGSDTRIGIITGLLIVAIADNVSDSLGIHVYIESEGASRRDINSITYGNFLARLFLVFIFIVIILLFPPNIALVISSVWGLVLLAALSYFIAKGKNTSPAREIIWHLVVALAVVAGSNLLGRLILKTMAHL